MRFTTVWEPSPKSKRINQQINSVVPGTFTAPDSELPFIRHDPRKGFKTVKDCVEGVIDFVSVKQRPVTFSEDDIRILMIQMFDREQARKFQKA